MRYRLHPEAAAEHKRQVAWYEERQAGLGRRYHAEYLSALALALAAPHRYKIVRQPAIRRIGFRVFHFDLIYREAGGVVEVLAVAPQRREPSYWASRL
ncbi:MAG TPA: type II toxin-antitoxin system RelE/ParE family toxin [Acidobacteria bacterium]|nr:type II toxin-antitoxin system RelE/ParE family toxin [Acidobacteriota bacterium]